MKTSEFKPTKIKKITIKDVVEYDNDANDYFHEWWMLSRYGRSSSFLQPFEGKKVKITIEVLE